MILSGALLPGSNYADWWWQGTIEKTYHRTNGIAEGLCKTNCWGKNSGKKTLLGIKSDIVSPTDIQNYILEHHDEIERAVGNVVEDLCRKILPGERVFDLLKQFGVLSLFLVYPLVALVDVALRNFQNGALQESVAEAVGILLLLALLIASAIAVFRKERKKDWQISPWLWSAPCQVDI